jgi:dual specificity phosphatase 12
MVIVNSFAHKQTVREQTWINPGFHEQLVLFELCGYNPTPAHGVYAKWKWGIDARLRAAGLLR